MRLGLTPDRFQKVQQRFHATDQAILGTPPTKLQGYRKSSRRPPGSFCRRHFHFAATLFTPPADRVPSRNDQDSFGLNRDPCATLCSHLPGPERARDEASLSRELQEWSKDLHRDLI